MYDTILVPTDGSEHAVQAAEHGLALARLFDATVHVLTVVDVDGATGPFDEADADEDLVTHLEAAGEDAIESVEAVATDADRLQTDVVTGEPAESILEYTASHDVDLVAMGTHGRTGLDRYVTGSVTEHVVRHADVPVLSVRAGSHAAPGEYDNVLIPTDGSEYASVAIDHGLAIAERADARVHAVNVVDLGDLAASPSLTTPTELASRFESAGEDATEVIAGRARAAGLDVSTEVREGVPAKDLMQYADGNDVDLIAMGTHGRTGLSRYLLGSTTERIIRHADMPVLAVNAQPADD
ncbi:universal stress protein [Halorientalis brevis]|uniref:Universal stress protein n=1 Tax=Halorientalis brevis TaxID=1126241 RepID=A0ABD6CFS8_9EURY|nr:universal stress protein [Halorientalis brevis]